MPPANDRMLAAAGAILIYAAVIGYTDNHVRVIAAEGGLWQFHAMRSVIALMLLALLALPLGLRLRPARPAAVAARSAVHGVSMLIYFGSLAFLPVAQVAAGLFTAPIFVLLIGWLIYGQTIGAFRLLAVALGFGGVVLVLGPGVLGETSVAALLPVAGGALYALGNIATREWCAGESAETLLAGFFVALAALGLAGMGVLAIFPLPVAEGAAGFVQRGAVWPSGHMLFWIVVQAVGSLFAIGLAIRAYQLAETARVSIFEYAVLPASAFWGWWLWGETLTTTAIFGMALIAAAGVLIASGTPQAPSASAARQ